MTLAMFTGHPMTGDETHVPGDRIRFRTSDGRAIFFFFFLNDGKSIEVRAVENVMIGGVLYANRLQVSPRVSNVIEVSVHRYDD